jgi:quercetin dioxygenase-like cupin family protein
MSDQHNNGGAIHELASLYALQALDARETAQFEEHLRAGCEACAAEVAAVHQTSTAIGSAAPVDPPPHLRDRLMSRVARSPRTPGIAYNESGLLIARSEEISWKTLAPGISFKPLFRDKARNSDTMLVRMDAGARLPKHRHTQVEELFLLSGDLHVEDQVMYAGDYCRANLDSVHDLSFTETGCLFLLMTSPVNEILA